MRRGSVSGSADARPIVEALRKVIRREAPGAEESVVWGALSYHRPWIGGRVKGAVCQIVVKHDQVRLDFIHGIRLPDPRGLLRGDRLSKRYVPIPTVTAARSPAIAALIEAAAAVIHAELDALRSTAGQVPRATGTHRRERKTHSLNRACAKDK